MLKRLNGISLSDTLPNKMISYLDGLPKETVVTTSELSETLGVRSLGSLHLERHDELCKRRIKIGTKFYWGSLKTISAERNNARTTQHS